MKDASCARSISQNKHVAHPLGFSKLLNGNGPGSVPCCDHSRSRTSTVPQARAVVQRKPGRGKRSLLMASWARLLVIWHRDLFERKRTTGRWDRFFPFHSVIDT